MTNNNGLNKEIVSDNDLDNIKSEKEKVSDKDLDNIKSEIEKVSEITNDNDLKNDSNMKTNISHFPYIIEKS